MATTDRETSAHPLEPLREDELHEVTTLLKAHAGPRRYARIRHGRYALQKRGIDDFSLVEIDPLATGRFGEDFDQRAPVVRGVSHVRRHPSDNGYARPIEAV